MIKIPVMIAAFREIDKDSLNLEEQLIIDHKFTLDPTSEISDRPPYCDAEVFELLNYMILASCNESTNMLADRIGIKSINKAMEELKCPNTRISHLLYKGAPLVDEGIDGAHSNTTTPDETTRLMKLIYKKEAASKKSCNHMMAILENKPKIEYCQTNVNKYLVAGLPKKTLVGSKIGLLENDVMETAAINRDYILTVMINKIPKEFMGQSIVLMAGISRMLFDIYYSR